METLSGTIFPRFHLTQNGSIGPTIRVCRRVEHLTHLCIKFLSTNRLSTQWLPRSILAQIEVKENYSPSHELKAITVMYKIKGYNPDDGDWFWVKYSAKGKTLKAGKPGGCIGCHATRVANDYVLVHEFK